MTLPSTRKSFIQQQYTFRVCHTHTHKNHSYTNIDINLEILHYLAKVENLTQQNNVKYTNTTHNNQTAYLTTNYTINHTHPLTQLYIKQTIIRMPAQIPFHHTPPTLNLPNKTITSYCQSVSHR